MELDEDVRKEGLGLSTAGDKLDASLRAADEEDAAPPDGCLCFLLPPGGATMPADLRAHTTRLAHGPMDTFLHVLALGTGPDAAIAADGLFDALLGCESPTLEFIAAREPLQKPAALGGWQLAAAQLESMVRAEPANAPAATPGAAAPGAAAKRHLEALFRVVCVAAKMGCVDDAQRAAVVLLKAGLDPACDCFARDELLRCLAALRPDSSWLARVLALAPSDAATRLAVGVRLARLLPACALKLALIEALLRGEGMAHVEGEQRLCVRACELLVNELAVGFASEPAAYHRWYFILGLLDEAARCAVALEPADALKADLRHVVDELRAALQGLKIRGHKPYLLLASTLRLVCELLDRHAEPYRVGLTGTFSMSAPEE